MLFWKITTILIIILNKHKKKMECRDLEVFGVWSRYVASNRSLCIQSAESSSKWSQSVVFVLSCKDWKWPLSSVKPAWCSSVSFVFTLMLPAGGSMLVYVCDVVCLWFECFTTSSSTTQFKSRTEVCSPAHWRRWRSSSYGWGKKVERQS